jgi:hypothetical protein
VTRYIRASLVTVMLVLAGPALGEPLEKAKKTIDPDCTVAKAARGAASKAVVGVRSNRCDVEETSRDALGIDDRDRKNKDDGPFKRRKK